MNVAKLKLSAPFPLSCGLPWSMSTPVGVCGQRRFRSAVEGFSFGFFPSAFERIGDGDGMDVEGGRVIWKGFLNFSQEYLGAIPNVDNITCFEDAHEYLYPYQYEGEEDQVQGGGNADGGSAGGGGSAGNGGSAGDGGSDFLERVTPTRGYGRWASCCCVFGALDTRVPVALTFTTALPELRVHVGLPLFCRPVHSFLLCKGEMTPHFVRLPLLHIISYCEQIILLTAC